MLAPFMPSLALRASIWDEVGSFRYKKEPEGVAWASCPCEDMGATAHAT